MLKFILHALQAILLAFYLFFPAITSDREIVSNSPTIACSFDISRHVGEER